MTKIFFFLFALVFLTSCEEIEEPELVEISNVKLVELKGSVAKILVFAEIDNPNFFNISMKPSTLDLFVDGTFAGTVNLDKKIKFLRKETQTYEIPLTLKGESFVLVKLIQWMAKPSVEIQIKGKVKGAVYGVSKKIYIDEKQTVSPSQLKDKFVR